ncbi:MAG: 16S rRNA (guanine(966)-N(2))-methyltransferase RsmD [bacterium]|nr:16S rRNA (guanine(966)-N(2))-methyltransferase RsmD [bacterium]
MSSGIRIVAGAFRGRLLQCPDTLQTRPTSQRVREAIFNVLNSQMGGKPPKFILDAFAGSGALGLEALSRGAEQGIFFEKTPQVFKILKENATHVEALDRVTLVPKDLFSQKTWPFEKADLLFLDPPYGKGMMQKSLDHLHRLEAMAPGALIVCEQGRREDREWPEFCEEISQKMYGDTVVIFLRYS